MTGSTLSEALKKQRQRKLLNKKLNNAINEYRIQKFEKGKASYREIADKFGVTRTTLAKVEQGKCRTMSAFNASKQKLTPAEEDVLVDAIILASRQGVPYTHDHIREEANAILQGHDGHQHEKTGKCWVDNFLRRHNDRLRTYWSAPLPSVRAKAGNKENIAGYFALVKERIADPKVTPECVWSMDETQVNPDGTPTQRVVGESGLRRQHQQGLSNKETITVLVTIGADGSTISPTTVFKGKKIPATWKANNISKMAFACSENGWTNSDIALDWLVRVFEPQTREKAAGRKRFLLLDGHSSHLSLRLLRKARELDVDIIIYPSHCTHLLQGLDVVCFAPLKQIWAQEIRMFEWENFCGVKKDDFAKVFGTAYQRTFTSRLVLQAWEATGIFPFNNEIIPPEKMAPSDTSTIKFTSTVVHATPVRKVMEAFTYFKAPPLDLSPMDVDDEVEGPVNERVSVIEGSVEQTTLRRRPRRDSLENPFVEPFTPSKRMNILRASLASSSSTSYLVSGAPIMSGARVITPQREEPEPFVEPDWGSLLDPNIVHLGEGDLIQKVKELQMGLAMARDGLRAREAVIESAHATNIILELTCQRQRTTLHRRESAKQEKKDKRTLFGDGKAHVVTDDDFVLALEEIEEREKEKKEGKERRKEARTKAKESKVAEKKVWEDALEEWKVKREAWEEECVRLRETGHRKKDLPKAPMRPKKAEVLAALSERDLEEGDDSSEEDNMDVQAEEEEEEGTGDEDDSDSDANEE